MVVAKMPRIFKATIQFHRGLAATWAAHNPILAYGEPGFEKDTNRLKIGDGETEWNLLPYLDNNYARFHYDDENNYADNFIAEENEICFVNTANKGIRIKLGDGITEWQNLSYTDEVLWDELENKVDVSYDAQEEMLVFSA